MRVYLACSSGHVGFVTAFFDAVNKVNASSGPNSLQPVYPPRDIPSKTGSVLGDVLQLRTCELVVLDVTPDVSPDGKTLLFNAGVMMELGIVLDQDNPQNGAPAWGGTQPRPTFQLLCDQSVQRSVFTPITGDIPIGQFCMDSASGDYLPKVLDSILQRKIADKLNFTMTITGRQGFVPPQLTTFDQ